MSFRSIVGSLTTPNCSPSVTWVIFPDPIPISLNQISRFRSLPIHGIENSILVDNYRHLQPIGKRKIFLRSVATRFTRLEKIAKLVATNDRTEHDGEDEMLEWYYH
jgi:carbonic anhydrase